MRTVTLSVKNVPVDVAKRLKARALSHHRSLQGELLALLTEAGNGITIMDLAALAKSLSFPPVSEAAAMVREDRDGRRR